MNKSSLYFVVVILVVYFTLVFCDDNISDVDNTKDEAVEGKTDLVELVEEGRVRRKHFGFGLHHHMWGWHALALAYFIKVKVVIVAFFVGAAVFWGLKYFWPHKCHSDIVHEGPIVYDHGPSFAHHDHTPYSFDHSDHFDHSEHSFDHAFDASSSTFDTTGNGPYSGYGGPYVETAPSTAPESHHITKRSAHHRQQNMMTEEQIAEFMFLFLGLDSKACRRRFICEMEFRSKLNPLTAMAFRIVGHGFFEKYTNARNTNGHAKSFLECAAVNPDCTVIEENIEDENEANQHEAEEVESNDNETINDTNVAALANQLDATVDDQDKANEANLHAERVGMHKRHRRTRKSIDTVAASILSRSETNDIN